MQEPQYTCPRCGAPIYAGQAACANCGLALDPQSIAAWQAAQAPYPAPGYDAPQAPSGYAAPPSGYDAPAAPPPGYGAPPPGYAAPPPGYTAPPPGYAAPTAPPPGYTTVPASYTPPAVSVAAPARRPVWLVPVLAGVLVLCAACGVIGLIAQGNQIRPTARRPRRPR